MKKPVESTKSATPQKTALRKQAEKIVREKVEQSPENIETLSPQKVRQTLHELRVHQIELEMQNEESRRVQAELDASRERYFDLYDLAPVGYCTVSEKGLILKVNLMVTTILGVPKGKLIKQPISRFIMKDDQDIYYQYRKQLLKTGEPQACELRMVKKNGSAFWVRLEATAEQDADGAPVCNIMMSDINEKKKSELYLKISTEILHRLNEPGDLHDAIQSVIATLKTRIGFDAVGFRLQDGDDFPYFVQDGFSKDFLLTENTLVERGADGGVCRDKDGNIKLECTCGLVISGKTDPANPLFTKGGSFWTNDSFPFLDLPSDEDPRLNPRNQCIHQGYASIALIPIRSNNRIVGLIHLNDRRKGCFTLSTIELLENIASHIGSALIRKHAEEALRESEVRFRTMIEKSTDAHILGDVTDGRNHSFVDCNQAALDMLRMTSREQLLASNRIDLSPERQPDGRLSSEKSDTIIAECLAKGSHHFEWVHLRADGEAFPVEILMTVIQNQDKTLLHSVWRDITERKKMEEELKNNREHQEEMVHERTIKLEATNNELEAFSYSVSHDLRAPLRTIDGFSHALLEDCGDKLDIQSKDYLTRIRAATQRMSELIEELMNLSKITSMEMNMRKINLTTIASSVINELQKSQPQRLVNIKIDKGIKGKADSKFIRIVLENLLGNAWKFTTKQSAAVIEFGSTEIDHTTVYFVRDNGAGFDMANADKLFIPFQRLHSTEEYPGTGIGLATVRRIIHRHGGNIWMEGEVGKGATFYFSLHE